jgi:hypothetical protein
MQQNEFDANYEGFDVDPFDAPIPGESLTNSTDNRRPWEQPPKYTDINEALQETFLDLTEGEIYSDLMDQIRSGFPVDELTQYIVFKGYTAGYWTTDLMMLLVEPVMYLLIALAEHNGIYDYVVYDGEEDDLDEEEATQLINDDAARMHPKRSKMSQAISDTKKVEDVVPGSLLAQVEQLETVKEMGEE